MTPPKITHEEADTLYNALCEEPTKAQILIMTRFADYAEYVATFMHTDNQVPYSDALDCARMALHQTAKYLDLGKIHMKGYGLVSYVYRSVSLIAWREYSRKLHKKRLEIELDIKLENQLPCTSRAWLGSSFDVDAIKTAFTTAIATLSLDERTALCLALPHSGVSLEDLGIPPLDENEAARLQSKSKQWRNKLTHQARSKLRENPFFQELLAA